MRPQGVCARPIPCPNGMVLIPQILGTRGAGNTNLATGHLDILQCRKVTLRHVVAHVERLNLRFEVHQTRSLTGRWH